MFDEETIAVCSPAVARGLRSPADLAGATLLHAATGCNDWTTWLGAAGAHCVDSDAVPKLATDTLVLEAATHGPGVALAHRRSTRWFVRRWKPRLDVFRFVDHPSMVDPARLLPAVDHLGVRRWLSAASITIVSVSAGLPIRSARREPLRTWRRVR